MQMEGASRESHQLGGPINWRRFELAGLSGEPIINPARAATGAATTAIIVAPIRHFHVE